ncbi:MAG: protein kinase [Opitutales bacterium]
MQEYSSTLKVGTILVGKYRVDKLLGEGGFGAVYKAYDMGLDRYVALKECLPCDFATRSSDNTTVRAKTQASVEDFEWAKTRFIEEARTLAKFKSNNLLSANNIFQANGTVYMDSDFIEGKNVEDALAGNRVCEEAEVLHIFKGILNGLKEVHSEGLMHRDIKPANIIIRVSDVQPVLIDFGSARMAVSSKTKPLTAMVTQGYAPLEQYYEDGNQGAWTDIYALAGVCYKMITGEKPPEAVARVRRDNIIKLAENYKGKYSDNLLNLLDQCLLVEEEKRPQSVDECFAILRKVALVSSIDENSKKLDPKEENITEEIKKDEEPKKFLSMKKLKSMILLGILGFCLSLIILIPIPVFVKFTWDGIFSLCIFSYLACVLPQLIGAIFVDEKFRYKLKFLIFYIALFFLSYYVYYNFIADRGGFIDLSEIESVFGALLYTFVIGILFVIWMQKNFLDPFSYVFTAIFAILFMVISFFIIGGVEMDNGYIHFILIIAFFVFPTFSIYIGEYGARKLGLFIQKIFLKLKKTIKI